MFVQLKNQYRGDWILVNTDHVKYATPERSMEGKDLTILQVGEDEILVAHSLEEIHQLFDMLDNIK